MSAQPVDVLAVMQDAAEIYTSENCPNAAEEMTEARAAVAELIEAGQAVFGEHDVDPEGLLRLRAALARCGVTQ